MIKENLQPPICALSFTRPPKDSKFLDFYTRCMRRECTTLEALCSFSNLARTKEE